MKKILVLIIVIACYFDNANAQVAASFGHFLKICPTGTVEAVGLNQQGQLGNGFNGFIACDSFPAPVNGLSGVAILGAGAFHSFAAKYDGTVWGWGYNIYGQLGNGTNINTNIPVQISGLTGIIAIDGGEHHSVALKNDGTVWAWGKNSYGQLGDGTTTNRNVPVQVNGLTGIIAVDAGHSYALALKNDGTIWAWGRNDSAQLGNGTNISSNIPVQVSGLTEITAIKAGDLFSIALKNDGIVWAWGNNNAGQLGNGTNANSSTPVQVNGLSDITNIAAGGAHSIALTQTGTLWAWGNNYEGQLGNGNNLITDTPVQVIGLSGITALSAGGGYSTAIDQDGTIWVWGSNAYGQLGDGTKTDRYIPIQMLGCDAIPPNRTHPHYAHGYLYNDANNNCTKQTSENGFSLSVVATPGNHYAFSDTSGLYSLGLNNSVNYTITPVIPQRLSHMIVQNPCPFNYLLSLDTLDPKDTIGFDFGFDYSLCHQLRVDIASTRRRRCFFNTTSVFYTNEGLAAANNVEVKVKMPEYVIPVSTSLPYTWDADSNMVFALDTLNAGQSGYITIIDSVACINGITGLTQCTEAWITPPNTCLDSATTGTSWDKSSVRVEGGCLNDTVRFVIYNTGEFGNGDMDSTSEYRIYADNVLMQTNTFQIAGGDSLMIMVVSGGATIRLEADQRPGHPGNSRPRETVEGCGTSDTGTFTVGMVNQSPQDDADVDVEIDCMPIRDSYDPNEKAVSPEGVEAEHNVLPNTLLDYTIHFQNTGTDTAYKVIVIDTLPASLDLSTFEPGTSSFPYTLDITGEGVPVLKFTLNFINLTDTFINEPGSHGFVKFKVAPFANTPLGTEIHNSADIYFDYNLPITTNDAWITLKNYPVPCIIDTSIAQTDNTLTSNASGALFQWFDCSNFNLMDTTQSFTPQSNGTYAVIVQQNGCKDTSACITITGVGIGKNVYTNFDITVSPNPFTEKTTITVHNVIASATEGSFNLKVYDVTGREIYTSIPLSMTNNGGIAMELKGDKLLNGIYLYKVFAGKEMISTGKLVLVK